MTDTPWHGLVTIGGGLPWATREAAISMKLKEMGFTTWLPREPRPTKKFPLLTVPIVSGYVFVEGKPDWPGVRRVRGILRPITRPDGETALFRQLDIDRMKRVCEQVRAELKPGLRAGDKVRIRRGAHAEIEAIIAEVIRGKATVTFDMLGKPMRATVPVDAIARPDQVW